MKIDSIEAQRRLTSSKNLAHLAVPSSSLVPPSSHQIRAEPESLSPREYQKPQESENHQQKSPEVRHQISGINSGNRGNSIPEFVRDTMGLLRDQGVPANLIAQAFGVVKDAPRMAQTGWVGGKPPNEERRAKINERRLNIQDQALFKLMESLNLIDTDKLGDASAKELSGIAVNLAKVSQLQSDPTDTMGQTNIVVYAPQLRDEKKFKTIEV